MTQDDSSIIKLDTLNQDDYLLFACLGYKDHYSPVDIISKSLVAGPFTEEEVNKYENLIQVTIVDFLQFRRIGKYWNYTCGFMQVNKLPKDIHLKIINIDGKAVLRKTLKARLRF